jgi:hypothetical protein
MIIAMITVRMVQPAVHKIVNVVAMRHLFMSAVWTVCVWAVHFGRALRGICRVNRDDMFVHVILVHMVEMAVVKIIHVAVMANRGVPAFRAMPVSVVGVVFLGTRGHWCRSFANARLPVDPRLPSSEIVADPAMPRAPHKLLIFDQR